MGIQFKDLPPVALAEAADVIAAQRAGLQKYLTLEQVSDLVIARLTTSAPEALDAWLELVAQIEGNQDGLADLVTAVGLKADAADTDINALTAKATPVDADEFRIADSAASFGFKKLTWANLKAAMLVAVKSFFNASGTAPVYACRAWVVFNGSGGATIQGSGNISSVTKVSAGLYEVTMATAMPDANYCVNVSPRDGGYMGGVQEAGKTTTAFRVSSVIDSGAAADSAVMNVTVFR